jgi:hypothetical protein
VAVRVADAARRLTAELSRAGSPPDAVAAARDLSAAADAALQAAVDRAREAGVSWREIGDVLGTSRQAVFQRFGHPVDPRSGELMSRDVPPDAADRAVAIFAWHDEGRWQDIIDELDDRMRARLDAGLLARGWAHMAGLFGRFEGEGEPFAHRAGDDVMVDVPLHWEAGDARGIVRFNSEGRIAGLAIRPLRGENAHERGNADTRQCLAVRDHLRIRVRSEILPAGAQLPMHFGPAGYTNWAPRNVGLLTWPALGAVVYVILVLQARSHQAAGGHGLSLPVGLTLALVLMLVNHVGALRAAVNRSGRRGPAG